LLTAGAALVGVVAAAAAWARAPAGTAAVATERPEYAIRIRIEPPAGTIDGLVEISSPGTSRFVLSRDLRIRRVLADGRPAAFDEPSSPPEESTREVIVSGPAASRLTIEYGGTIRRDSYSPVVSLVSMVRPDLVELASYAGWYPRLAPFRSFSFQLALDLPAGFVPVTNGRELPPRASAHGREITTWRFDGPASDIVVVAAPRLRQSAVTRGAGSVEVFAAALPQKYVDAMIEDVAAAIDAASALTGAPRPAGPVRIVYSPRPGWGYVRQPLIVVSEENALAAQSQEFGAARDLRYITHEVAHYWWHFADTSAPDDWINEGLAEYTAFIVAGKLHGAAFASRLLEDYRERSENSATTAAIADTASGSPDREVNRYARPVLVLDDAERKYGSERMAAFIRALYRRFSEDGRATTGSFLSVAESTLGPEARVMLSEALFRREWRAAERPSYVYSPPDARFLGTWTGALTQAGATNTVVLHLAVTDGSLTATLESPDQNAKDIPVPTVRISGDSLYFALGAFGVAYRGVLDAGRATLAGEWRQGGVGYPLTLTRR
jgi:hypothetical protein